MRARIYQPTKSAMQSGRGRTRDWVLEFEPAARRGHEHLMGWTSSSDTGQQVRLTFHSRDEAVAYAERHGMAYDVEEPHKRRVRPKNYAANFRWNRVR